MDDDEKISEREKTQLIAGMFHTMRSAGKKRRIPGQERLNEAVLKRAREQMERGD